MCSDSTTLPSGLRNPDGKRSVVGGDGSVIAVEFADTPRAYSVLANGESAREDLTPPRGSGRDVRARAR